MPEHKPPHPHEHSAHRHATPDPALLSTDVGIRAVRRSLAILLGTAAVQTLAVAVSGSVALLADTIHNAGDALTAIPLWLAFRMARREPNRWFSYGYGRVEDLAGLAVVVVIAVSALLAAYESVLRFLEPREISHLGIVAAAALVGFAGNEAAARIRIKAGRRIASAALIADGQHARVDALTSLSVLFGAAGVWLGFPQTDPIIGLGITGVICVIAWTAGRAVIGRLIDETDPHVAEEIRLAANSVPDVQAVTDVRVRWMGHRLEAEVSIAVDPSLTVQEGHAGALDVRHHLLHHLPHLRHVTIHVDPADAPGLSHHRIISHAHDGLPAHSH